MEPVTAEVIAPTAETNATSASPAGTKKQPQKRKKTVASPDAAAPEPGTSSTEPGPSSKQNGNEQTHDGKPPVGTSGSSDTPPTAKKQKKKDPNPKERTDGKKQSKPSTKQVRFHIKLYGGKQPTANTNTATVKKKTPKQPVEQQQPPRNGNEAKKPSKKSRSKTNGKPSGNGEVALPPSSSFTPLKRVAIKQEPKTPNVGHLYTPGGSSTDELDSVTIGRQTFAWLIGPTTTVDEFMRTYWERKPLLVQRTDRAYYAGLLSRTMIDEMLRTNNIEYTKNIDITSYTNGHRETHNPDGRVLPPDLWHYYGTGCSVRMLNPQTYLRSVYELNVKLQEYFHCMTGANFYLTPPDSQGFAPHYDDIEAFVLQIEGRKRWRLYPPRHPQEVLARVSSENLREQDLAPTPLLDVVLEPGDMLYFPRGCIHQAATVPGAHSLHLTLSVYQRNSWADLFEQLLPCALSTAADEQPDLRAGIPLDLHHHFGIVHSDELSTERRRLIVHIRSMFDRLFSDAAIDAAVDQLAKRFQHDALPPLVDFGEWDDTVYGAGNYDFRPDGTVRDVRPIDDRSSVRLLRRNILRLVNEEDRLRIYYHTDNSREYHQYEANFLELDHETALGVELLVKMYPRYVPVSSLPVEDRLEFIRSLWEKGLIVCRRPDVGQPGTSTSATP